MKINLSFPPEYPFKPLNDTYFQIPHEVMGRTGLAGFHERTISRHSGLAKDRARWRIINTFLRTRPRPPKVMDLQCLTNPGAWWHFERIIRGRLDNEIPRQRPIFTCCEKDPEMFRLSAVMMATVFNSAGVVVEPGRVSNPKKTRTLLNQDTFEYLAERKVKANLRCIWLDLTSTLTEGLAERLKLLRPHIAKDYCLLAITLIRGREQGPVRDALADGKKRKRVMEKMVRSACGDDFRIADLFDYADSMPMQQVIFLRGTTLGANAPKNIKYKKDFRVERLAEKGGGK